MIMDKKSFKFIITFLAVLSVRLLPFRAPNIEPILAIQMPFSKVYGVFQAMLFGMLSIITFDLFTSTIGPWSIATAISYGIIGLGSGLFFKKRSGVKNYILFSVVATIVYDALTGLTVGPLVFGQSFYGALIGQIPFTLLHLIGNVLFAMILSLAIEKWVVEKDTSISVPVASAVKVN